MRGGLREGVFMGEDAKKSEETWGEAMGLPLACLGAVIGAGVGVGVAKMAAGAGFYAVIVVGVMAGVGAMVFSKKGGVGVGVLVGVVAICASLWAEWYCFPFLADGSLGYFVAHVGDLKPFSLLLHGVGAVAGGWIAARR